MRATSLALLAAGLLGAAPGHGQPARPAAGGPCAAGAPLTLVGFDSATGRALFALGGGELERWLIELEPGAERASAHPLAPDAALGGGSFGPGPIFTAQPCGRNCLQPVVWDSGSWRPLGEALLVPATVNVHGTYDRGGAPWLVLHQTAGARGMVARAFRLEGREWILKGRQAATDAGHPGALAVPDLPDAVVSGTALFQAEGAPGYWLEGLPDLPPERRGEITPLGGSAAAYVAADGLVYLTADRGASWRRSAWTPWGTGLSPVWRPGEDFRVEPPVGGRRSPFLLAWFDNRIPDQTSVILTEVSRSGSWRELARLPMRLGPPGSEPREAAHLLAHDDGTWIVLADGCFPGPAGPGLFLSTLRGTRQEAPRRVPIAAKSAD
jgi:hypothetical protein